MPSIKALFRYPVKGLSPEPLDSALLRKGRAFPDDRRFAIAHGDAAVDNREPGWLPKRAFLALDSLAALASLSTHWDEGSGRLEVRNRSGLMVSGNLYEATGRKLIEDFFNAFAGRAAKGGTRIVEATGFSFTDAQMPLVSIISHASLAALERACGRKVDARRLRANIEIDADAPGDELAWVGQTLAIGEVRLRVLEPIMRCAATCANPDTGVVDINLLRVLARAQDEPVFGVYAEVVGGGMLRIGAQVRVLADEDGQA